METMDDFKQELNDSFEKLDGGDIMSGKVENEEQAGDLMVWNRLKELKDSKETLHVKIGGMVNGGLIAYVEDVRGFIPASQISEEHVENLDEYLGKNLDVRITTVDMARKRLVLSAREILREKAREERKENLAKLAVGEVKTGKVESLKEYGAFVDLGNGITGLLHVSQIANKRLKHPGEVLQEGQEVEVKITKIEGDRISLSMKALEEGTEESAGSEEKVSLPESRPLTNSMADLLKGIKL